MGFIVVSLTSELIWRRAHIDEPRADDLAFFAGDRGASALRAARGGCLRVGRAITRVGRVASASARVAKNVLLKKSEDELRRLDGVLLTADEVTITAPAPSEALVATDPGALRGARRRGHGLPVDADAALHRRDGRRRPAELDVRATRAFVKTLGNGAALRVAVYGPEHSEREAFAASWLARSSGGEAGRGETVDAAARARSRSSAALLWAVLGDWLRTEAAVRFFAERDDRRGAAPARDDFLKATPDAGLMLDASEYEALRAVAFDGGRPSAAKFAAVCARGDAAVRDERRCDFSRPARSLRESIDHGGDAVRVHKRVSIAGLAVVDVDAADNAVPAFVRGRRARSPWPRAATARSAPSTSTSSRRRSTRSAPRCPCRCRSRPGSRWAAARRRRGGLARARRCGPRSSRPRGNASRPAARTRAPGRRLADAKAGRGDISAEDAVRFEGLGLL
ncbi:hypothetical protein JL721_10960 [Aureococcus anophagefferens]|nr:hypothetical protein JL721_10960 [Aureococcus anophagefferens]